LKYPAYENRLHTDAYTDTIEYIISGRCMACGC